MNVNYCYFVGLGNGSYGKLFVVWDVLVMWFGSSYVDFVGVGGGGNVVCVMNLWVINIICGRKLWNSVMRIRKLMLVDFLNLVFKLLIMCVDVIL